jgi:hypothetical protein
MGIYNDIPVIKLIIFYRCPEAEQQNNAQQPYHDKYFFPQMFGSLFPKIQINSGGGGEPLFQFAAGKSKINVDPCPGLLVT